jgi:hypothetical protein
MKGKKAATIAWKSLAVIVLSGAAWHAKAQDAKTSYGPG